MMAFVLSFAFGAVAAALMPVVVFLAVVALASVTSFGIALAQGGALAPPLLRIGGEVVCAQVGYVAGVAGLALIARARTREYLPPRATAARDREDDAG